MASEIYFSTNPADYQKLEGLYISERNPPGFIRGVDLSVVGMAGKCVRGPTAATRITSVPRFIEVFGGRDYGSGGVLVGEVWAALLNKQFGTIVVRRVVASDAAAASFNAEEGLDGTGTEVIKIEASSLGAWGNSVYWKVEDATDEDADHFNLVIKYLGEEVTYENLNVKTSSDDNLLVVIGDDIANWVVVTKLADGRPENNADITETEFAAARDSDGFVPLGGTYTNYTTVDGDDGTLAATDYDDGLEALAVTPGVSTVLIPEATPDQNATNGTIVTLASTASDRVFLTWSGTVGQTPSQEVTNIAADITTRSDRIIWCYNAPKTKDPETGVKIDQAPHIWMASIFSQYDVDVHPGAIETARQLAGVSELNNEQLTRQDLIDLKAAGISTLEKTESEFLFRSGVTTDLTAGKTEITRRRMADFLQLSAASRLKNFVRTKNTLEKRAQMNGELVAFSNQLKDQGRIIEDFEVEQEAVNTEAQRAQGIEKILWRVKLIGHILSLVLATEIGTGVVIERTV